jgi:hypothetical protein
MTRRELWDWMFEFVGLLAVVLVIAGCAVAVALLARAVGWLA